LKKILFIVLPAVSGLLALLLLFYSTETLSKKASSQGITKPTIILDAGHGEPDGGTRGVGGESEKDINLSITLKTAQLLTLYGFDVMLTRPGDDGIYSNNAKTIRQKKVEDMHKRLAIVRDRPNSLFVSIHQNYYEGYSVGCQIFYSPNNEESKLLAQTVQDTFKNLLQPDNNRKIKASDRSLYLLHNIKSPAIMVECGFLSDVKEARLLNTEDYQRQVAFCITSGLTEYIGAPAQITSVNEGN